jgi:hypothetical protein
MIAVARSSLCELRAAQNPAYMARPLFFNGLQNRRSRSAAYAHSSGLHYGKGISQPRT